MQGNQRTEADPAAPHADEPAEKHHSPTARSLDRFNRWLALGANLGVVLGLVILIIEVRQNAELTRAAMETQKNTALAQIELSIASPEMSTVWMKSVRTPETLTDPELRMLESHLVAVLLQWEHMFQMERAGLVSREDSRQHVENSARFFFGSRFGKQWWTMQEVGWIGTPLMEVAGPILNDVDETFLQDHFDAMRVPVEPVPTQTEGAGDSANPGQTR